MASYAISDIHRSYKSAQKIAVQCLAEAAGGAECTTLSGNDLVRQAKRIVAETRGKQVPRNINNIVRLFGYVIAGRRECSAWYRQKAERFDSETEKDSSHDKFRSILEIVVEHLRQLCGEGDPLAKIAKLGKQQTSKPKSSDPAVQENVLINIFEALADNDTLPEAITADTITGTPVLAATSVPEYELQPQEGDDEFALWCFFEECHNIRICLSTTWRSYQAGKLSVTVASDVTDKAFQLIHLSSDDFAISYPHLATFPKVARHLRLEATINAGKMEDFRCKKGIETHSTKAVDTADVLCISGYIELELLRAMGTPYGTKDPTPDQVAHALNARRSSAASHPFTQRFVHAVGGLLNIRQQLLEYLDHGGDVDTFCVDVLSFMIHKELPLYCVVDYQICMDIVDIIGDSRFSEIQRILKMKMRVMSCMTVYEDKAPRLLDYDIFPDESKTSSIREQCKRQIKHGFENPYKDPCPGSMIWQNIPLLGSTLLQLPVTCGWLTNMLQTEIYADGVVSCNNANIVLAVAHLYTACKNAKVITGRYEDLEFVIETQSIKKLGLLPLGSDVSVETSARLFDSVLGAKKKQRNRVRHKMDAGSRMPLPDFKQVQEQTAHKFWPTSAYFDSLASARRKTARGDDRYDTPAMMRTALLCLAETLLQDPAAKPDEAIKHQWETTKSLTPSQLLAVLRDSLAADELRRCFDHHALLCECANLLARLKKRGHVLIGMLREKRGLSRNFLGYEMVSDILWQAAEKQDQSPAALKSHTLLGAVSAIFQNVIDDPSQGSKLLRRAEVDAKILRCDAAATKVDPTPADLSSLEGMKMMLQGDTFQFETKSDDGGEMQSSEEPDEAQADGEVEDKLLQSKGMELMQSYMEGMLPSMGVPRDLWE
ncbi:hypothetical protein LTR97_005735 [Elasticomyces elasticus]|uniref:DUF6604 domain-containing protein n=1 Tax=Elasticomyces elasticus TaxID=574655 RepID=A0AAN8A248_9PEZI|nr:hypothetical protein LTR97_005735 [Elasticomyces elasticus]